MTSPRRFPPLAVPFAALGGAAGWLFRDVVKGRFDGGAIEPRSHLAVAAIALVGFVAGALLGPSRPAEEWMMPEPRLWRVVAVVLAAGLAAGMILAALVGPTVPWLGAPEGALAAAALLPACLLVIAAQRRADEARPGSIVARAEQRAVVAVVALGAVILAALTLPDWMSTTQAPLRPPRDALFVAALAGAVGLAILIADLVAARRMKRIRAELDLDEGPTTSVDFGLGEDVATRADPGAAYRGGGRVMAQALGDPDRAEATLRRAIRRGVLLVATAELVAIGHGLARNPAILADVEAERCEHDYLDSPGVCREAALLSERAGLPDATSTRLHQRACSIGSDESCVAVYLLGRRNSP